MVRQVRYSIFALVVLCAFLAACGGGGGGEQTVGGSTYTGISTPATITTQNAQVITEGVLQGGLIGATIMPLSPVSVRSLNTSENRSISIPQHIPEMIFRTTVNVLSSKLSNPNLMSPILKAPVTESGTEPDYYGIGSMSYTLTADDVTGDFNGSITFNNYHISQSDYINGTVTASGRINLNTFDVMSITISSNILTGVMGGGSYSLVSFSFSANVISYYQANMSFSYYLRDGATGDVFWVRDYTINMNEVSIDTYQITISGTFYHPDYGYVAISTTINPVFYIWDYAPRSGVIMVTGANNTNTRITFINNARYRLEVCDDGDGIYEASNEYIW